MGRGDDSLRAGDRNVDSLPLQGWKSGRLASADPETMALVVAYEGRHEGGGQVSPWIPTFAGMTTQGNIDVFGWALAA